MAQTTRETTAPPYTSRITLEADEDVTSRIVREIGTILGRDPTDLPDIHASIDPDGLDGLFDPPVDGTGGFAGSIGFEYGSYRVRIDALEARSRIEDGGETAIVLKLAPLGTEEF